MANDKNKSIRLATIRGSNVAACPFGLPITQACKSAGDSVERMGPLSLAHSPEQVEKLKQANQIVYAHHKDGKRCRYADALIESVDPPKVNCDFGDTAQGQHSMPWEGSPMYLSVFHGLNGIHSYPAGLYVDNSPMRNAFYGIFSYVGFSNKDELLKLAEIFDESNETDKSIIVDNILNKLEELKKEYKDTYEKLEEHLNDIREYYNHHDINPAFLWHMNKLTEGLGRGR